MRKGTIEFSNFFTMSITARLLLVVVVVIAGFAMLVGTGTRFIEKVRVGGDLYRSIALHRQGIEQMGVLRAEMYRINALTFNLVNENRPERFDGLFEAIEESDDTIYAIFDQMERDLHGQQQRALLAEIRKMFVAIDNTMDNEFTPALRTGRLDQAKAIIVVSQQDLFAALMERIDTLAKVERTEVTSKEAMAERLIARRMVVIPMIVGGSVVLLLLLLLAVTRSITRPIRAGAAFARRMATGDLTEALPVTTRDELGKLIGDLNEMVVGLSRMVSQVNATGNELSQLSVDLLRNSAELLTAASAQDQGVTLTTAAIGRIDDSARRVGTSVEGLAASATSSSTAILEMVAGVEEVAQSAGHLAGVADHVSSAINEMAASSAEVAAHAASLEEASAIAVSSIMEMDSTIREVQETADETARIAEAVRVDALAGMETVEATVSGMGAITDASRITSAVVGSLSRKTDDIGAILDVIDEVAQQTNLLALNAAIIAAQAGVHGKGFAVVADEIKKLADRTRGSTREIAFLIKGVQDETARAVAAISIAEQSVAQGAELSLRSGEVFKRIVTGIEQTSVQMGTVARATFEQSQGSRVIRETMEQVAMMITQISCSTQEQGLTCEAVMQAAEEMRQLSGQVRATTQTQSALAISVNLAARGIIGMIEEIRGDCATQEREARDVVATVATIQQATVVTTAVAHVMHEVVGRLSEQVQALRREMAAFKV